MISFLKNAFMLLGACTFFSITSNAQDEYMRVAVSEFNRQAPLTIADNVKLTKASCSGETMTIELDAPASVLNADTLRAYPDRAISQIAKVFAKDVNMKNTTQYMYNKDLELHVVVRNAATKSETTVVAEGESLLALTGTQETVEIQSVIFEDGTVKKTVVTTHADGTKTIESLME